jgi:D-apionolactonase
MRLLPLSAGPLSLMFDRSNAFLRYIRGGDEELVRGIFAAVRDRDWNTIAFSMDDIEVVQNSNSFHIRFVANSLDGNVAFCWNGSIEGTRDGTIHYQFNGRAEAPFYRNRIGLCVLHPGTCAGKMCRIEHVDGTLTDGTFPTFVSPHQPFKNIRAIEHHLRGGEVVRVSMTGDVFEMEDQRNWTDASYKTYSTPLEIPFPVQVAPGTEIEQSVTIELRPSVRAVTQAASPTGRLANRWMISGEHGRRSGGPTEDVRQNQLALEIDWMHPVRRPSLGFQWLNLQPAVSPAVIDRLTALNPDHLRVDVWLNQNDWQQDLASQIEIAQSLQIKLEVAVFAESIEDSSWQELMRILQQPLPIARVLLFHNTINTTPSGFANDAKNWLDVAHPTLPIVVGTNAYFAELNRGRPVPIDNGQVCYSINPQVHAFDNHSLNETLEAQPATVDSAVEYFNGRVVLSPVTLRPRFNPNATSTLDRSAELNAAVDPRQTTGYGAAWTVGVLANLLTHPQVDSLTLFEAFGSRGVIADDGTDFPMTQPIEAVLRSQCLFSCKSPRPLQLVALGIQWADETRYLLLGNLSTDDLALQFDTNGKTRGERVVAESVKLIRMDEDKDA